MHIKAIVSAVALTAALGFGSVSYAQDAAATALPTMIGNQELSEADAQRVQTYCDDLNTVDNQAQGAANDDVDEPTSEEAGGSADTAAVGTVDMSAITLETCTEAGFISTVAN